MFFTAMALLLNTSAMLPGTGTLWLDGESHPVEVTSCGVDTETAGAKGTLPDGSSVSVMLQRWPGMHALSVTYDNAQWLHRGPEDSADAPELKRWVEDGMLKASGTVSVFPPIRQASMVVRFEGRCP
ncbi:hypothetical protein [Alkalimonas amylolytica]|uniref:Uncharacterized protein n=1 Tax=Alkalimonas amylolytica TaxID=152573 RepID=A0A1H4G2P9_ALKAM|nr:hypothetical protein [Alkalimonas amylolytica]SEB02992.1 hypothetical protein SAMN04488051_11525 [Alkalimonas amylolytica]